MAINLINNRRFKFKYKKVVKKNCIDVFVCQKCGIHPKAISVLTIDGDENKVIVQCKNIKNGEIEIKHTIGKKYNLDGGTTEELICGKCGRPGRISKVPKMVVDLEEQISEIEGV